MHASMHAFMHVCVCVCVGVQSFLSIRPNSEYYNSQRQTIKNALRKSFKTEARNLRNRAYVKALREPDQPEIPVSIRYDTFYCSFFVCYPFEYEHHLTTTRTSILLAATATSLLSLQSGKWEKRYKMPNLKLRPKDVLEREEKRRRFFEGFEGSWC